MKDFNNEIVYVVGGSMGIGLAAAKLFAERGAHVCIFARNQERLEECRKARRRPGEIGRDSDLPPIRWTSPTAKRSTGS